MKNSNKLRFIYFFLGLCLMLKYSFPDFNRILEALRVGWRNSTLRLASTPKRKEIKKKNSTLYSVHSRVGRGNLVFLNTPLLTFRRIQQVLLVEWRHSTPRYSSTTERRNVNIYLFYFLLAALSALLNRYNKKLYV